MQREKDHSSSETGTGKEKGEACFDFILVQSF